MNPSKSFQLDHFLAGWIGGEGSNAAIDYLIGLSLMGGGVLAADTFNFSIIFSSITPPPSFISPVQLLINFHVKTCSTVETRLPGAATGGAVAAAESRSVIVDVVEVNWTNLHAAPAPPL